jgi:hypothetical protein
LDCASRSVLGAQRREVVGVVVGQGMRLGIIGIAIFVGTLRA